MKKPAQATEELLVLRAQLGDTIAFQGLVKKYTRQLILYCRSFRLDTTICEDIVQDAWLVAFRSLGRLESAGNFRSWLFGITRNKIRQSLDKKTRDKLLTQNITEYSQFASPESSFKNYLEKLPSAFERLSVSHREILTLRFINQMSHEEIADSTGIIVGTIKSRIHYAKNALREILESMKNER
jgi:RNA polymerase sigma-70 factor (ECF subfamily)